VILTDASPLISLIDKGQNSHQLCLETLKFFRGQMLTTWSCFTEAMYFLGELQGWNGQNALWNFVRKDALLLHLPNKFEIQRTNKLMEKYQDVPMDLADVTLVALAETENLSRIFTLDSDFFIYRINDKKAFQVFPQI
jgi:uncharacterized protein